MDYGKFIRILRNVPFDAASEKRIWDNISGTLEKKRSSVFLLADMWPRFLVSAAALAVVFVILFYNYEKQFEARNFVQRVYSTEYIYEICKYDGQWN
jgi:hypothetical protein